MVSVGVTCFHIEKVKNIFTSELICEYCIILRIDNNRLLKEH
jgi:hypothetical protein